jgi:CheY-like chemotaxis protein
MAKKILLADDSITIQKVIELTFSDEDFDVVTVGNGRLAIEKVQEVRPDVVLCDIIMPEKDGYEVCDFVKKQPGLAHIPVLLLTGAFEPFDQERASRVGCDGFLAKPFEPQALIAKVKDLLRQAEARQSPSPAAPPAAPPASAPAAATAPAPVGDPSATIWAAPEAPPAAPVWEAPPQTRPLWGSAPTAPAPAPAAAPSPAADVHFISEDPFADDASGGYPPVSGDTVRVPTVPDDAFDNATDEDVEPYVLEPGMAAEDELLPMTPDEEESLSEPLSWEPPVPAAAPPEPEPEPEPAFAAPAPERPAEPSRAFPVPSERDLFLEEVFEDASNAAHPSTPPYEPPPPPPAPLVPDFDAVARDAGVTAHESPEPAAQMAPPPLPDLEPDLEPEPEAEPEPELEPDEELEAEPAPLTAAPEPEASYTPFVPEPMPPLPTLPSLSEPSLSEPSLVQANAPEPPPAAPAEEPELMEESFAALTPETASQPAEAAPPTEAGAVAVPVDMVSQIAQRVVAQISEKVIREIAWEVIPDMAEALIKKEIERLTAELRQS